MMDQLTTVTSSAVSVALDALSQRQQLIATNLANANIGAATLHDVRFEDALRRAMSHANEHPADTLQSLASLKEDVRAGGLRSQSPSAAVQMDAELVRLNETVIRYQALIEGLGKYGSLVGMAISGEVKR
jgi:flagellar basal-body rod protein FlgB